VPDDHGEFLERHLEARKDFARAGLPQRLNILVRDAAETEPVGDIVHVAQESRKAVGERAVWVEDDEEIAQKLIICCNGLMGWKRVDLTTH
jgi:hypothetical protein